MSNLPLGLIIELLVAVLLLVTIGYCWILNRRLQRLRADEQVLRATISELMTATEIAERAILGLKQTASNADKTLGSRLLEAEKMSQALAEQVTEGEKIFTRISQIADATRNAGAPRGEPRLDPAQRRMEPAQAPAQPHGYGVAPAEPRPRSGGRADDIRTAAAEATARLERFRNRPGGAAA
ncbi:hypothetical protein GCM10011316_06920 [Roseibium aquae]|uniref:DUF6468 domain-containing protein n=1 Tax=Roseibium aquae TaxID=1323746 RepID=A0A916WVJ5_9HYPH|nr:DUF6468 domain-containing protein [Roseibium aquae]GGB37408.1 hypothetical protein GCM10011316_06920 [Roseibium aquae]